MANEMARFDALKADIVLFVEPCKDITVADESGCDAALEAARNIKSWAKKVEDRRKELVGPLNEQVKQVNNYAKQLVAPLLEAETHIKKQLGKWNEVLEARQKVEWEAAEKARKEKEAILAQRLERERQEREALAEFESDVEIKKGEIVAQADQERSAELIQAEHDSTLESISSMKVSGSRKVWKFEIVAEAEIPREYMAADEVAIRRAIMAGQREIPGVRIYQESQIAIGGSNGK